MKETEQKTWQKVSFSKIEEEAFLECRFENCTFIEIEKE